MRLDELFLLHMYLLRKKGNFVLEKKQNISIFEKKEILFFFFTESLCGPEFYRHYLESFQTKMQILLPPFYSKGLIEHCCLAG